MVEADSFAYPGGSVSFPATRATSTCAGAATACLRIDEQRLEEEPEPIAAVVAAALGR